MRPSCDWSLYLVTDRALARGRSIESLVAASVRGGVTAVQLREKNCSTREFVELGRALKAHLASLRVPLIVNDRLDVALAVSADGVHIGQQDMDYPAARRLLGPDAIIGLSIETEEQALAAASLDVDYLGVGPVFTSATKPDAAPALGLRGLARVRAAAPQAIVAIGGIDSTNVEKVIRAGAGGIAVVSAICAAEDPASAARELRRLIEAARTTR